MTSGAKKSKKGKGESQPPQNIITHNEDSNKIFEYSAIIINENKNAEYSVLYPETNSDSASGKSNGTRFVSANIIIKNKIAIGNKGNIKKILVWATTIAVKFKEFDRCETKSIEKPKISS